MPPSEKQSFVVTLSGSRPIQQVASELSAQGFQVGSVLEQIGVITGSAHPSSLVRLRSHPGIKDISEDQPVDIGPPGAPLS